MTENSSNPTQRALILQGGGALGAYEVGALQEFCRSLALEDDADSNRRENQPMFDIVCRFLNWSSECRNLGRQCDSSKR